MEGRDDVGIERQTHAVRDEATGWWRDVHGMLGPVKPGEGPRSDPVAGTEFPTGPEVGSMLPDVVATSHTGEVVDVHARRAGGPAVVVFSRSAVW